MNISEYNRNKINLICGIMAMFLLGIGDVLLGLFPGGGDEFLGGVASTSMVDVNEVQYIASLIIGLVATVIFIPSAFATVKMFKSLAADRGFHKTLKTFTIGMVMMAVTMLAAHSVCCLDVMIVRKELLKGLSVSEIEKSIGYELILSFAVTNIWITVSEIMVSVAVIIFIARGVLPVKKWMVIMNPICSYVIFKGIGSLLSVVSGSNIPGKLLSGGASWGYGLLFIVMLLYLQKNKSR